MSLNKYMEIKNKFIDSTINVIAAQGLDKASTRAIANDCNLNDALIFRYFDNKNAMFKQSFIRTDREIYKIIWDAKEKARKEGATFEGRSRAMLDTTWDCLMAHKNKSLFYVRFYYSVYYRDKEREEHVKLFTPLIEEFKAVAEEGTMVDIVTHAIFDMLMSLVVKGLKGELPHDGTEYPKNFKLLYSVLKAYLDPAKIE
ncbi:MAG: TetR/AcrR family transcriptional regulator [Clostridia bacterium]|nr:TetR/AcrR family transcriptional regulator [Clostridia bacterium]